MKQNTRLGGIILAAAIASAASTALADSIFPISFTSSTGLAGSGYLAATENGNSGIYTATSGWIDISGAPTSNGAHDGIFELLPDPVAPATAQAIDVQGGANIPYDDQIFPGNDPSQYSQVDGVGGLVFLQGTLPGAPGIYISADSSDQSQPLPTLYFEGNYSVDFEPISLVIGGFFPDVNLPASPVPLPASAGIGFAMLGGFGVLGVLRKRISRTSRIA